MELTLVVVCFLATVCLIGGTRISANDQSVPRNIGQGVYTSAPRFSATRKYANTFSYKRARIGKSSHDIKNTLHSNKNEGIETLVPKPEHERKHMFSYKGVGGTVGVSQNQHDQKSEQSTSFSNVNDPFIDVSSPVHQSLVSSIEKLIADALGVTIQPEQKGTTQTANVQFSAAKTTTHIKVVNSGTESIKKTTNVPKKVDILDSRNIKVNLKVNKNTTIASKSNSTANGEVVSENAEANESAPVNGTTSEPAESVQAEVTTPEPVEATDPVSSSYNSGEQCFCMPWCPVGTFFNGNCGMELSFGYRMSMCCLSDFMFDDDDSD